RRLSIAVLLDGNIRPRQQEALKEAFAAAAGLDLQPVSQGGRGDQIVLLPMPFDRSQATAEVQTAQTAARQDFRVALIRNGSAVAVVILVMLGSLLMLRRSRAAAPEPLDVLISEAVPLQAPGAGLERLGEAGPGLGLPALNPAERVRQLAA